MLEVEVVLEVEVKGMREVEVVLETVLEVGGEGERRCRSGDERWRKEEVAS